MSLYTAVCSTKYDLLQNGFGIIQDGDIPNDLESTVDAIHRMIIGVEEDDSDLDANTSSINLIDKIFQINLSKDVVDGSLLVEKSEENVGDLSVGPDPHAVVTNVSVNPLPRRKRFASTWKRIKRSVLRLCCCVR
jgi:hypothetical protein